MFLGIDAGGTKTTAILIDETGTLLGYGRSGPANYQAVGIEEATRSIVSAVKQALSRVPPEQRPKFAVLGLAGADRLRDKVRLERALRAFAPFCDLDFFITTDAHVALVGAMGKEFGVVLIGGTGAMAFGIDHEGRTARADGWGYLLGDEGSAYWIGIEILRSALRAHDGRGPATVLLPLLLKQLKIGRPDDLVEWAYQGNSSVATVASLSRLAFVAAMQGDRVAMDVIRRAGTSLGQTAVAVVRRLNLENEDFPIAAVGGLFQGDHKGLLLDHIEQVLRPVAPRARWLPPRFPPEVGAAILALSRRGRLTEIELNRISQSMVRLFGGDGSGKETG